jgi:hypothetical protein
MVYLGEDIWELLVGRWGWGGEANTVDDFEVVGDCWKAIGTE